MGVYPPGGGGYPGGYLPLGGTGIWTGGSMPIRPYTPCHPSPTPTTVGYISSLKRSAHRSVPPGTRGPPEYRTARGLGGTEEGGYQYVHSGYQGTYPHRDTPGVYPHKPPVAPPGPLPRYHLQEYSLSVVISIPFPYR